jgi:uncharacterized membrane protein
MIVLNMEALKDFLQGKWLRHPLHPALVHIPTALWPSALLFDVLSRTQVGSFPAAQISFYAITLGLLAALLAVPTGLADWSDIRREKPAWKLGLYHMGLNLTIFSIQIINLLLRREDQQESSQVPLHLLGISLLATLMLLVSGYLGGRMIYAHGINVARISKGRWRQIAEAGGARLPKQKQE